MNGRVQFIMTLNPNKSRKDAEHMGPKLCLRTTRTKYENIIQKSKKSSDATALSPTTEKLKQEGIEPKNFTLKQLFPEVLDKDGITDLSLLGRLRSAHWTNYMDYEYYCYAKMWSNNAVRITQPTRRHPIPVGKSHEIH